MNSRFKFRVWDKEEKEYLQEGALIDSRTGFIVGYLDADCFIVEQCTGLKDKNGKLIFEGDVVRCITGVVGKVVYFHAGFKVVFDIPMSYPCDIWEDQEIIGNIHEDQFRDLTKLMESEVNNEE